jgi:hypothetical protein
MNLREGFLARAVLGLLTLEIAAAVGLALIGSSRCERVKLARPANRRLVSELGLADLALWSDASYCRHSSLAVFFSAHSDHPSAMEHFPAGSMVPPPSFDNPVPEARP